MTKQEKANASYEFIEGLLASHGVALPVVLRFNPRKCIDPPVEGGVSPTITTKVDSTSDYMLAIRYSKKEKR